MADPPPSNRVEAALEAIVGDLSQLGHGFAVVGGWAVSVRTEPRFTRDVDIAVALSSDIEAEALTRDLSARGYTVAKIVEQESVGRLATVRLVARGESRQGIVVDILFASSGIEAEVVEAAQPLKLTRRTEAKVAQPGHLLALKLLSRDDERRPQDIADIRALLRVLDAVELERAAEAVALIESRGFARGRDLRADLAAICGTA